MLCSALNQIRNREGAVYEAQRCVGFRFCVLRAAEYVNPWMYAFAVRLDFTLIHSLSFIFFTRGTADEFQMLSGFLILSSLLEDCHPIITLTQVLILNYKPVTKLIFSYSRRAHGATQELRWISSADFCGCFFFFLGVSRLATELSHTKVK